MKKITVIICLCAAGLSLSAQNMPSDGNSGLGFNIMGLADVSISNFGQSMLAGAELQDPAGVISDGYPIQVSDLIPQSMLMFKRYYDGGWASRFSLGLNSVSAKTFMGDSTGVSLEYMTTEEKLSGFSFGLGLGMEKHMETEAAKVDPYLGADLMLAMLTGIDYSSTTDITGDGYSSNSTYDVAYPGGLGFALNLVGGFNYFFSDNISIGGEVGLGFGMVKTGGEWTSDFNTSSTVGGTTTTTSSSDRGEYKSTVSGIQVNSTGAVNLIIYW